MLTRTCPPGLIGEVQTCPKSDFWSHFARFGSKTDFLIKFPNDSAWFCLEELQKHAFLSKKYYPPIRRVSTKGAKLQQTLQSFSRVSTQSFSRDSVQSSSFSRDSALGVRRGGSAGVGGRGRGRNLRLRSVTFGYIWDPLFLDFIF